MRRSKLKRIGLLGVMVAATLRPWVWAQSAPEARPKFDVASIKPCKDGDFVPGEKSGRDREFSPGTLRLDCQPVMNLIQSAYVLFANGHVNPRSRVAVEGGAPWIRSELYQIDAKSEVARSQGAMRGPMLQTLLEDRFQLRIHRATREVPAYAVTVAKGGIKLRRFQVGSCIPLDLTIFEQFPPPPLPELPPGNQYCGGTDPSDGTRWIASIGKQKGPNVTVEARALSIDEFIKVSLGSLLDRPVVNRTGLKGLFDFHLEFAPDESMSGVRNNAPAVGAAAPADLAGPSIFTAMQRQLGLKLEPAKGRAEFLVIDQVNRPSSN